MGGSDTVFSFSFVSFLPFQSRPGPRWLSVLFHVLLVGSVWCSFFINYPSVTSLFQPVFRIHEESQVDIAYDLQSRATFRPRFKQVILCPVLLFYFHDK